jgi:hypothetical protein
MSHLILLAFNEFPLQHDILSQFYRQGFVAGFAKSGFYGKAEVDRCSAE